MNFVVDKKHNIWTYLAMLLIGGKHVDGTISRTPHGKKKPCEKKDIGAVQTCANLTVLKKSLSIQSGSIQPWPSPSVFGPLLLGLFFFYVLLLLRSIETPLLILTVRTTYCDDIPKLHFRTTPTFIFMYFNLLV